MEPIGHKTGTSALMTESSQNIFELDDLIASVVYHLFAKELLAMRLVSENCKKITDSFLFTRIKSGAISFQEMGFKNLSNAFKFMGEEHCKNTLEINDSSLLVADGDIDIMAIYFPKLSRLVLDGINLTAFKPKHMTSLTALTLERLTFHPFHLGAGLKELNLGRSRIKRLDFLKCIPNLETLNLACCNELENFRPIGEFCTSITGLELSATTVKNIEFIKNLSLTELSLSYCSGIQGFDPISHCTRLKKINLSSTAVTDSALNRLKGRDLTVLEISGCQNISENFDLSPFTRLHTLNIARTKIKKINNTNCFTQLKILDISHCEMTTISALSLIALNRLSLCDTRFNLNFLKLHYPLCSSLTYLDLSTTNCLSYRPIKYLKSLKHLDLSRSYVKDISFLQDLPLVILQLHGCVLISNIQKLKCLRLKTFIPPYDGQSTDIDKVIQEYPNLQFKQAYDLYNIKKYEQAFAIFTSLASQGDVRGEYYLGVCKYGAFGTDYDKKEAVRNLKLAAAKGHKDAQKLLDSIGEDSEESES